MRQLVLDTETTGLDPAQGHRIIEIGCVELLNRRRTERRYHQYLNPERAIEDGAFEVHGISRQELMDKPRFGEIAADLVEFIRGAEVLIHNAAFDVEFINSELRLLGPDWGQIEDYCSVTDTLALARELHPGQRNSLDALCARYSVDNSGRELHGALKDANLLADVYLAMTGGQAALLLDEEPIAAAGQGELHRQVARPQGVLRIIQPSAAEQAAHQRRLQEIDRQSERGCLWLKLEPPEPAG
jgi:DNA polymerase-3 subunit epsilon